MGDETINELTITDLEHCNACVGHIEVRPPHSGKDKKVAATQVHTGSITLICYFWPRRRRITQHSATSC